MYVGILIIRNFVLAISITISITYIFITISITSVNVNIKLQFPLYVNVIYLRILLSRFSSFNQRLYLYLFFFILPV